MNSKKFPMIEELGLQVTYIEGYDFVRACGIERVLAAGKIMRLNPYPFSNSVASFAGNTFKGSESYTHTGLLINIKPIEKPRTIEDVAKDLVDIINRYCNDERTVKIVGEAKKLLGEK